MEAVQFKDPRHASYFRHQPRDLAPGETKCTYLDETHRHKVAKEILQRLKSIKVPVVHKYPPKGQDGVPMVVRKAQVIDAVTVRNEVYFFEDENGLVQWSRKLPHEAHELVKPDVTFFDKDDKPVLFIELEATHRVSEEKKARLRHIGIDAVEVILPTGPFEEIEEAFKTTSKTKWLFNGEEQRTRYVQPSVRDTADVPPPDELQRGVFEETYACRKSMVGNLIRAIDRCLESEPYRRAEESLGTELSRVTENSERTREELRRSREEHRGRVEARFAAEIERLEAEEALLRKALDELEERRSNLEGRYQTKRAELETATGEIRGLEIREKQRPEDIASDAGYIERSIEQVRAHLYRELEKGRRIQRENASAEERERQRVESENRRIASEETVLAGEEGGFAAWAEKQELAGLAEYRRLVRQREARIGELEASARVEQESLGGRRESLEREFEERRTRLAGEGLEQVDRPATQFESGIKAILDLGGEVLGMMKIKRNISGLKEHAGALHRALTKAGINHDEFLTQYDAHCASEHMPVP